MSRAFYVNALLMADRHVTEGKRIIANQRLLITRLDARRADTTEAKVLLATFLISQHLHEYDQQRFASELAKLGMNSA